MVQNGWGGRLILLAASAGLLGCDGNLTVTIDTPDQVAAQIDANVNVVQTEDPRTATLPSDFVSSGDTIIIDNSVTIIDNVQTDIIVANLPDETILGFENVTGVDFYIQYFVDGELQGIFVFDGETLLLDYNCIDTLELVSEDDFDPFTGDLVDSFDLNGVFTNPEDFQCGDAFILHFDFDSITVGVNLDFVN